jgi:hypothetical protein
MSAESVAALSSSPVVAALRKASEATGSDFGYLLKTAMRESNLKTDAKAATSSAAGLFQFVDQTWLGLVKSYGGKYGLGSYAAAISKGTDGRYHVDTDSDRQAILGLRGDAQVSSLMAGEYTEQCRSRMQGALGRPVSNGELYAAHFLGADAAARLISLNETAPGTPAAEAFAQAADANRSVFYHADGTAKSVGEVYAWATRTPQGGGGTAVPSQTTDTETSKAALTMVLAQFQTRMLASALLSEPTQTDASASSTISFGYDMLDVLSSLQNSSQGRKT